MMMMMICHSFYSSSAVVAQISMTGILTGISSVVDLPQRSVVFHILAVCVNQMR